MHGTSLFMVNAEPEIDMAYVMTLYLRTDRQSDGQTVGRTDEQIKIAQIIAVSLYL